MVGKLIIVPPGKGDDVLSGVHLTVNQLYCSFDLQPLDIIYRQ